ncbi:hypothetical protein WR25_11432 [Diploscapter pachys]|uniref:Glycine zipper domain-containing protein n=1 Tax=Diploscapter pachys TaxID=2018661 RepID=A0A2A2JP37_9BILA|nr:hypothetical protein WR25_11432 [Diploscapter pachys]
MVPDTNFETPHIGCTSRVQPFEPYHIPCTELTDQFGLQNFDENYKELSNFLAKLQMFDKENDKKLRDTMLGVAKQTGYTAAGAVSGGLMFGPPGALVGSVIGAVVGYQMSEDYDNIITVLRGMSDEDKARLGTKVQGLVGAVSIEEFVRWIQNEGHRALLLGVLSEFARQAASKANVSY